MKQLCLFLLTYLSVNLSFGQKACSPSETIYRSIFNQTIRICPENPDKVVKKRNVIFIDTTKNSIFSKNLSTQIDFDDYQQSIIDRACRDFKASKKIKNLWSFEYDTVFNKLPKKWFEAQTLNNTTYIFCPNTIKGHYAFHLTDSTIIVSKGDYPRTYFIKTVKKDQSSILLECFNGSKFTVKYLDKVSKLAIWKIEDKELELGNFYRLLVPTESFKYYNMIVNHSANKVPDDFIFDDVDYDEVFSPNKKSAINY